MGILKKAIPRKTRESWTEKANSLPKVVKKVIPSAITLSGIVGTEYAARNYGTILSLLGITYSRGTDDIDGDTARALDAVTTAGTFLDVLKDKYDLVRILPVMFRYTKELSPEKRGPRRLALGFIAAKHAVIASLNIAAQAQGLKPHSEDWGKRNMFVDTGAVISFVASDSIENARISNGFEALGYATTMVGVFTGVKAIGQYVNVLRNSQTENTL